METKKKIYAERLDTSKIVEKMIQELIQDLREFWHDMGDDLDGQELVVHYTQLAELEIQLRRFEEKPLSKLMEAFETGIFNFHPQANWEGMDDWDELQFFGILKRAVKPLEDKPCKFFYPDSEKSMTYEERRKYESNHDYGC